MFLAGALGGLSVSILVACLALAVVPVKARAASTGAPAAGSAYAGQVSESVQVPTRYGDKLTVDLEFPAAGGKPAPGRFPVIACLCYIGSVDTVGINFATSGSAYARAGYVAATVRVPGSGTSEGGPWDFTNARWQQENYDAIQWLGSQPWSDGKVGTIGESGNGMSQIFTSQLHPPDLKTMIVEASGADSYDTVMPGGMLSLQIALFTCGIPGALTSLTNGVPIPPVNSAGLPGTVQDLAYLAQMNLRKLTHGDSGFFCPAVQGWYQHPARDSFWTGAPLARIAGVRIPVWTWSGWDDIFRRAIPNLYLGLGSKDKMLTMGLNSHESPGGGDGFDQTAQALRWFDHWLKGESTGITAEIAHNAFQYYLNGAFVWKTAPRYPIPGTKYAPFYLASREQPGPGQGSLQTRAPSSAGSNAYLYLPPSIDALTQTTDDLVNPFDPNNAKNETSLDENLTNGDQRLFAGPGTVTYVSAPLTHDVQITGPVAATLFARTTASDTDFVFKLDDVFPDHVQPSGLAAGYWKLVTEGNLKGTFRTYRAGFATEAPIPTGQVVRYDVEGYPTAYLFKTGHRIAVTVQSSETPLLMPNLHPAVVTILHSVRDPSEITLPVIGPAARTKSVRSPGLPG
jgi:putative CocE/NonD family hydrolase